MVKANEPDAWDDNVDRVQEDYGRAESDAVMASKAQRRSNFTLKGKGQSDSWLVVYFSDIQDGLELINSPELDELMDAIAEKNEEFQSRFKGASAPSRGASAGRSSGGSSWGKKPAAKSYNSEPEYDEAWDCEHGEREWVDKGTWRAWMCSSQDRDDKCGPLWANKDGSLQEKRKGRR